MLGVYFIAYSARCGLFVLMCRKTHVTHSLTGWETLKSRRKQHKLILFYKMVNNLTPIYLSSLLPPQVGNISRYNLRNQDKYQTINCKSQLYFNSFLPSSVRDWNLTEDTVR